MNTTTLRGGEGHRPRRGPRLSPYAQIVPCDTGWLLRHHRRTIALPSPVRELLAGPFLDLLNGAHDIPALAAATGVDIDDVSRLIAQMTELDLFDGDSDAPRDPAEAGAGPALPRSGVLLSEPLQVLVVGSGELAAGLCRELLRYDNVRLAFFEPSRVRNDESGRPGTRIAQPVRPTRSQVAAGLRAALSGTHVAAVCADQPTGLSALVATACREARVPAVFAELTETGGIVGPVLVAVRSAPSVGCPLCAGLHRADRDAFAAALPPFLEARWPSPAPWRWPHCAADITVVARLCMLALCKALEIARGVRPADSKAMAVDFSRRTASPESVPKHHGCDLCYPKPRNDVDLRQAEARRWWEGGLRDEAPPLPLTRILPALRALTGSVYGLFDAPRPRPVRDRQALWQFFRARGVHPGSNPLANAHSVPAIRREARGVTVGAFVSEGFDFDDADVAEALALIEGLERLYCLSYCAPRRIVQARLVDVASDALDPRGFPLHAERQYEDPGFPLRRFDPGATIPWLWAVDIATGSPVLVPLDLVYASSAPTRIYRANSNGAACHSSLRHAVINGIHETIERDALMVTWLNRLSLPRLALDASQPDPWSVRRTLAELDLELTHVDMTTDLDIPVLLAVLRDRRNPDFFLIDMVSSLDPRAQLQKLYRELAQFLFPYLVDQRHFINDCTRSSDPDMVVDFPDHVAFYQAEARNRQASFLATGTVSRPFGEGSYASAVLDANAELGVLAARLAAKGHRVLVVDCSVPLLRELGLHAVKVLIPGLQPLSCGHRFRVLGGDRILDAAQRMGYASRRRRREDLNAWPHPFW